MKKAKIVTELKQVHGKDETQFRPITIDQVLGDSGVGKYRTMDETIYAQSLEDMNKSDLQTHAAKLGVMPIDDRNRLTTRLMTEFSKHVASYQKPAFANHTNLKPSKEVLAILAQGR